MGECVRGGQSLYLLEVQARRREQVGAVVVLLLQHTPGEGEAVGVKTRGWEADHGVALLHAGAVEQMLLLDEPDTGAREVQLVFLVDARQLRRLASDERDACGPADLG